MFIGKMPSLVKNALIESERIYKSSNKMSPIPIRIMDRALTSKVYDFFNRVIM